MNGPILSLRAALAKPSPPSFARRRDRVVFPALDELRMPRPLRHVSCCALLRLPDERIRFLRATCVVWDDERLDAAERMLASLDDEGPVPPAFVAMNGALRVTPLTTLDAIRDEGRSQELCIAAGFELLDMSQHCANGYAYLLAVRDATTGRSLSTVEVEAHRPLAASRIELRVRQHKARGNTRPAATCVRALREVLQWAASREVQEHLDEGRRQAALRRRATPAAEIEADRIAVGQALRLALGETLYGTLARACTDVERLRRGRGHEAPATTNLPPPSRGRGDA